MRVVGGREIHPINVRVGGFYRAPSRAELAPAVAGARGARASSRATRSRFTAALPTPDFEEDFDFVALRDHRPLRDRVGPAGLERPGWTSRPTSTRTHFVEEHVAHSTALHSRLRDGRALPRRARWRATRSTATSSRRRAREAADAAGLEPVCRNPFRSIVVRAVEILYALDEALRLHRRLRAARPAGGRGPAARRARGYGWSEAPRGMLWHRYAIDADGTILDARIVPPTSQNQGAHRAERARLRRAPRRARRRGAAAALRAGRAQLRPVHLVRDPLPAARDRPRVTSGHRRRQRLARRRRRRPRRRRARARRAAGAACEHEGDGTGLVRRVGAARRTWSSSTPPRRARRRAPSTASTRTPGRCRRARLRSSTHAFGVPDAVELARALGAPARRGSTSTRSRARTSARGGASARASPRPSKRSPARSAPDRPDAPHAGCGEPRTPLTGGAQTTPRPDARPARARLAPRSRAKRRVRRRVRSRSR